MIWKTRGGNSSDMQIVNIDRSISSSLVRVGQQVVSAADDTVIILFKLLICKWSNGAPTGHSTHTH